MEGRRACFKKLDQVKQERFNKEQLIMNVFSATHVLVIRLTGETQRTSNSEIKEII
jgi:hypothetical protein